MFKRTLIPKKTVFGSCYLNLGCGSVFNLEWNNLDFNDYNNEILHHDLRQALPFDNNTIDAIYCSHVLEHLEPEHGEALIIECRRVLKPNGIIRIVVPDLQRLCREYLQYLQLCLDQPTLRNRQRYQWVLLCLIDQMVRTKPGGKMLAILEQGSYDGDFILQFSGEDTEPYILRKTIPGEHDYFCLRTRIIRLFLNAINDGSNGILSCLKRAIYRICSINNNPRHTGELHRWMYDCFSVKILLENNRFDRVRVCCFDESAIPYWHRYNLDKAKIEYKPRKPDSIYIEALCD